MKNSDGLKSDKKFFSHDSRFLYKVIYNTVKNAIGAIVAVIVANLLGLNFPLSAGVIAILSMLDSRKETIKIGMKRIIMGMVSLVLASLLFVVFGYNLVILFAFILIISFVSYFMHSAFSIASSLVLAGHIYQTANFSNAVFFNEVFILIIGVVIGFLLTIHMPDEEKYLKQGIVYIEEQYKNHLIEMASSLMNLCVLEQNSHSLKEIEKKIMDYLAAARRYRENNFFGQKFNYDVYFEMRLEQVYRLAHMKEKLETLFVSHHEAKKLSEFTQIISTRFCAHTPVDDLLKLTKEYHEYFKKRPLPETRTQFECRATLFQYLVEMEEFISIKARYIERQKQE